MHSSTLSFSGGGGIFSAVDSLAVVAAAVVILDADSCSRSGHSVSLFCRKSTLLLICHSTPAADERENLFPKDVVRSFTAVRAATMPGTLSSSLYVVSMQRWPGHYENMNNNCDRGTCRMGTRSIRMNSRHRAGIMQQHCVRSSISPTTNDKFQRILHAKI